MPSPFSKGSSAKCFLDQRHRAKRFRTSSSAPKCITALTRGHCSSSSSPSYSGKWRRLPSRHRLTKETSKWSTQQIIGQNANSRLRPISKTFFSVWFKCLVRLKTSWRFHVSRRPTTSLSSTTFVICWKSFWLLAKTGSGWWRMG